MPWFTRVWRRYQKPSALVLDQMSKIRAESVLDIIEDALGSALANKQQQQLKLSFLQHQKVSNANAGKSSTNRAAKGNVHQSMPTTVGRTAIVPANIAKNAMGRQQNQITPSASLAPSRQQRTAAGSLSGLDRAGSCTRTVASQRQHSIELQEVVVHSGAVDDQQMNSIDHSAPPSPPSSPSPDNISLASGLQPPHFIIDHPASSMTLHMRSQLNKAGYTIREASLLQARANVSRVEDRRASIARAIPLNICTSTAPSSRAFQSNIINPSDEQAPRAHSSTSPRRKPLPDLLTAAALAAPAGSRSSGVRLVTPSRAQSQIADDQK